MALDPAAAVNRWIANEAVGNAIIQGPATGPDSVVNTDNGPVPTLAKALADVEASPGGTPSAVAAAASAAAAAASAASAAAVAGTYRVVRVASTANVTIANPGTATFDGIALTGGDRILVLFQTNAAENGIYDFNGSGVAMTRSADSNSAGEIVTGQLVGVSEGSRYADSIWMLKTNGAITIGTTALTFTKRAGARNALLDNTHRTPAGTASTTYVQMGLGTIYKLTPNFSGRVRVTVNATMITTGTNSTMLLNLTYGTGAAPSNGAAFSGAFANNSDHQANNSAGSGKFPATLALEVSGLTIGTAYWFDPIILSTTGNGVALDIGSVQIEEIPND